MKIFRKKILALTVVSLLSLAVPFVNAGAVRYEANDGNLEKGYFSELPESPYLDSDAAIVINAETGQVLYEYNAYQRMYPASITKILTALVAIENGDFSSTITMSETAVFGIEEGSSSIALDVGEQINFEDAMYAMMLVSANEASLGIAEKVSGSIAQFCTTMNKRAEELGCKDTHFTNSNGLHDENHYSTAYDMALITREAIKNPAFIKLTTDMEHIIPATNKNTERHLYQETRMRIQDSDYYYPYCLGGKTGYTDQAGGTLVTWAEKDGVKLICVDMHTPSNANNYTDSIALFNYCFDNYEQLTPLKDFTFSADHIAQAESCLDQYYNSTNANTNGFSISVDTNATLMLPKGYSKNDIQTKLSFNATNADRAEIGRVTVEYKGTECISLPINYTGYVATSAFAISEDITENVIADNTNSTDKQTDSKSKKVNGIVVFFVLFVIVAAAICLRAIYVKKQRLLYKQKRDEMRRNNRY